jgi:hypothetical protein
MKALIIENEFDVDHSIKAFLKDNPKLFSEVEEQIFCKDRPAEDLKSSILKADAIIVASTWMYKDQLEEYLNSFLHPKFPKKLKFFIHSFTRTINEWGHGYEFWNEKDLFAKIKQLRSKGHKLYDFFEDPRKKHNIIDDLNLSHSDHKRAKYVYKPMIYSAENDLFYLNHPYYDLQGMIEDHKTKKKC